MAEIPEALRAPVVYSEPGMDQVPLKSDLIYRQIEHGFDVRNDDETSRVIIARTLAFMRRHLLGEA